MDKYQLEFFERIITGVVGEGCSAKYSIDNDGNLVIEQNENYNIKNYLLKLENKDLSEVSYYVNAWKKVSSENGKISIPIDFDNPTTIIKISLIDGLVEDFEVKVILEEADKDALDTKYAQQTKEERLNKMDLMINRYETLQTVIFKPCCDNYSYTIVKWYAISKLHHRVSGGNVVVIGGNHSSKGTDVITKTLIAECNINDKYYCNCECAFKLAAEVTQYDKNGNELISDNCGFND